ncbi:class I SAM-dependent methyltransferase [Actinocorallia longicatena]|uniref:Methyltransferase domain-containing protein n=1 Tax=Actinocorallia longicatena TaxID=111803 RepID=A0ABP6QHR3_9ACTN
MSRETVRNPEDAAARIREFFTAAWTLAAVADFVDTGVLSPEAGRLLGTVGLCERLDSGWGPSPGFAALLAEPGALERLALRAAVRSVAEVTPSPAAERLAEARRGVALLREHVLPMLPGLAERLSRPGAAVLDARAGTGEGPAAWAEAFPRVRVVGIEPSQRRRALAAETLRISGTGGRVCVLASDLDLLAEEEAFDAVRVPSSGIAPAVLFAALPRLLRALRPDGWLVVQVPGYGEGEHADAMTRWRIVRAGGTPDGPADVMDELERAGFTRLSRPEPPIPLPFAVVVARRH